MSPIRHVSGSGAPSMSSSWQISKCDLFGLLIKSEFYKSEASAPTHSFHSEAVCMGRWIHKRTDWLYCERISDRCSHHLGTNIELSQCPALWQGCQVWTTICFGWSATP